VVVIEKRTLLRETLALAIRALTGQAVLSFPSVEKWLESSNSSPVSLVLVCTSSPRDVEEVRQLLLLVSPPACHVPSILLSDIEDADRIVDALDQGARGYIPTSVPLDVAIEAMRLVRAGGVYVPASSLVAARRSLDEGPSKQNNSSPRLTARQLAVAEALRKGRANKMIAYELGMRESTVKVHVRNIMRKLKAHNRTEVAFMMNGLNHSS
jgi:DNA-binding NarL/FixJ family response regulator